MEKNFPICHQFDKNGYLPFRSTIPFLWYIKGVGNCRQEEQHEEQVSSNDVWSGACTWCMRRNDGNETSNGDTASVDPDKVYEASCVTCHGGVLKRRGNAPTLDTVGGTIPKVKSTILLKMVKVACLVDYQGEELEAVAKWLAEKK